MTKSKMLLFGIFTLSLGALSYWGWKLTSRGAYETAEYKVVESDGAFEIREYPPLVMATTSMRLEAQGSDGSFGRLFRYISGANAEQQKVAMTTPVFMERPAADKPGQMGFVIPQRLTQSQIPEPSNEQVALNERDGGLFAVIRFSGRLNSKRAAEQEASLRSWMDKKRIVGDSDAECAGYDPPWTPGPLRRNEILIRING